MAKLFKCCDNCVHSRKLYYDNYVRGDIKSQKVDTKLYMCLSELHVTCVDFVCENYIRNTELPL